MKKNYLLIFIVLLCSPLLTSCGKEETPAPPPATATPTVEMAQVAHTPTSAPTAPSVDDTQIGSTIPAPLYFLSTRSGTPQIWRLDNDGATTHQITALPGAITAFDVSPVDSALVYVSDGALWWAEASGANARQLVPAPDLSQYAGTPWEFADWFNINNPRWSPDGTRVVYSQNGVWMTTIADGATALLLANYLPEPPEPETDIKIYSPVSWAPNGRDLLIAVGLWEGAAYALLNTEQGGQEQPLSGGSSVAWCPDSSCLFIGGAMYGSVGLKRVDFDTGAEEVWCQPDDCLIQFPYAYPDGRIAFVSGGMWQGTAPYLAVGQWVDGQFTTQQIRSEPLLPQNAEWSRDGTWLAVVGSAEPNWRALNRAPEPPRLSLLPAGEGDKILISPEGAEEWQPRWGANTSFTPRSLLASESSVKTMAIPAPAPWQPGMGALPVWRVAIQDNFVWAGWPGNPSGGGGLVRWSPAENRYDDFSDSPLVASGVWALAVAPNGNLWVGTNHGAARFDGYGWTTFTAADGLVDNRIETVAVAPDGAVWVGTWQGLSRYRDDAWQTFTVADGLGADYITALDVDADGVLWVGTYGGGVSRFDGSAWQTFTTADGLVSDIITALDAASGKVWVAGQGGISQYTDGAWQSWTDEQLRFAQLSAIKLVPGRGLWIATCLNGVYLFDGQQWRNFTEADGLATDCINDIAVDAQDNIWFAAQGGTIGGGISRYDGQNWQTFVTE